MEDGRNECYLGRTWCTERTQWVPALRQESRFIATASWGVSCQLPSLGRHLCYSSPRLLFSSHLALMECRYSPRYPCLYHRITWFQIKSMAPNFSSCGLTMAFTTFRTINDLRILPLSPDWEHLERRMPVLSTLWPSWPHFSIRYTGTQ